ncbi:unnamed protein product [Eretmochelys imbricata]
MCQCPAETREQQELKRGGESTLLENLVLQRHACVTAPSSVRERCWIDCFWKQRRPLSAEQLGKLRHREVNLPKVTEEGGGRAKKRTQKSRLPPLHQNRACAIVVVPAGVCTSVGREGFP